MCYELRREAQAGDRDLEIISQYMVDGGQDVTRRSDRGREGTGYDRPQEEEEMVKEIEEGWPVRPWNPDHGSQGEELFSPGSNEQV